MTSLLSVAALFQEPVDPTGASIHWIAIELGVIAAFFLVLMFVAVIAVFYMMKIVKQVEAKGKQLEARAESLIADVTAKVNPVIAKTQEIMEHTEKIVADLTPKIKNVSENIEQMSFTVRSKMDEVSDTITQVNKTVQQYNVTAQEANLRTRGQIARVDGMVTDALNTTHEVSRNVQEGIRRPIRKAAEVVQGWKSTLEGFFSNAGAKAGDFMGKMPFVNRPPKGPRSPYDF